MMSLRFLMVLSLLIASTVAFTAKPNSRRFSPRLEAATVGRTETQIRGETFLPKKRDAVVMMPATIEREKVKTGGPAILERPVTERKERSASPTKERKHAGNEAWEVRIYNDGMNTREHVARSLVQVTGMSEMDAYQTMMQAHRTGIAVVGRWVYEVAEMYHDALRKNGIVCDIVPVDEGN